MRFAGFEHFQPVGFPLSVLNDVWKCSLKFDGLRTNGKAGFIHLGIMGDQNLIWLHDLRSEHGDVPDQWSASISPKLDHHVLGHMLQKFNESGQQYLARALWV